MTCSPVAEYPARTIYTPSQYPGRPGYGVRSPHPGVPLVSPTETTRRRRWTSQVRPYARDRAQILRRLARLEGQVRGVARMIERDEACVDVMQQTAALRAAVDAVTMLLMEEHVHGCLDRAVASGERELVADEVMEVLRRGLGRPARQSRAASEP